MVVDMKKSRKIWLVVLIPFFVIWIATGGFVMVNFKSFSVPRDIFKKSGLEITLDTHFKYNYYGLYFSFLYQTEKEPYKIYLHLMDKSKAISGLEINHLKISYINGKTLDFKLNRYYEVPVTMELNPDDDYKETLAVKRLYLYIEDENGPIELLDHVDMVVELSGTTIMEDGTRDEILINANFEAKTIKSVVPFWLYALYG